MVCDCHHELDVLAVTKCRFSLMGDFESRRQSCPLLHLLTTANGTKRRKPRRRVYVSFWGSSGSAWTDGLGYLRRE